MTNYFDNWKAADYSCRKCNWKGQGKEFKLLDSFDWGAEYACPKCSAKIFNLVYPTHEEKANYDKLSPVDRASLDMRERREAIALRHQLNSPSQLPAIGEKWFVLMWDAEDVNGRSETLIKCGEKVIFRELAFYEDYPRFGEVAEILKERYGKALLDLIPTPVGKHYLYGDKWSAIGEVDDARKRIFGKNSNR